MSPPPSPAADQALRALLQRIVETARAIFGAAASSVFLLDAGRRELVFEAVAGEGAGELVGRRFPAGSGIAGSVLATGEPVVIDDVRRDPRFGQEAAESTGFVPETLMAVPLEGSGGRALGVLEVLDRRDRSRSPLEELELLGLFAAQAAIALELLTSARGGEAVATEDDGALLADVAAALARLEGDRRDAARLLLRAFRDLADGSATG
ncbi:MAG: GAF domain-containing protein [Thermoleophilia bacterium]|nr:GAF domain-containing protein [Thermoleophilia bacterium]